MLAVVAVLAGVTVTWSALPVRAGLLPRGLLWIAVLAAVCSLVEMAARTIEVRRSAFETLPDRLVRLLVTAVRSAPWTEIMMITVLLLEAEHADRPWHTGVLMIALLGYLLAVHLAETGEDAGVLRAQIPPLAAGPAWPCWLSAPATCRACRQARWRTWSGSQRLALPSPRWPW